METKRVRFVFKNDDILRENTEIGWPESMLGSAESRSTQDNRRYRLSPPSRFPTPPVLPPWPSPLSNLPFLFDNFVFWVLFIDRIVNVLHIFLLVIRRSWLDLIGASKMPNMDGFVLPPFESTTILKDKDLIRIRKREDALFIEGHNAAHSVKKLKALEKQPGNSSVLLLSNVEFEKEKEVYESDDSEEEDGDDLLEGFENPPDVNADSKERKRKASEKLQCSMKKKQRSEAPETFASDGHVEKIENPHRDGVPTKQKSLSQVEKKSDSNDKENVENNQKNAKLSDDNDDSIPSTKRSLELQENGKEIKHASLAPKETKKVPSRSARRKHAKRKWLQEMAKIQKKNATSESESLRNWKEDQAKAERNKVDGQPRGVRNWKKDVAKAETKEVDGQPKGLVHWKQFPGRKMSNNMGKHQQQNQNINVHEHSNRNGNTSWHSNQYSDEEAEAVPVVVRPGHIRFGNVGKEQTVLQSQIPVETIQWNGITGKKKGQKWGTGKYSFTQRNDFKDSNKVCSETPNNEKETISCRGIDFDNLQPLCSMPKEGDVIAYRTLELSSSWIPELSPYRVGKVSQPDNSLYKEDGSVEIDFYSLVDVRIVKGGTSGPRNVAPSWVNGSPMGNENVPITVSSSSNDKQTVVPSQENKEANDGIPTQSPAGESGGVSALGPIR
ncbi:sphere organelles protein-related [Abeliophyllum distichum]|uniref:Sphere organelles protein-related n=1 Tax=Abeliophyllum distichum TaxID=126358 RepID=A0ABD1U4Q5_9LAMI